MLFKLYKECMLVSLELLRNKGMNENRVLRSKKHMMVTRIWWKTAGS